jgi:hypothetical protein
MALMSPPPGPVPDALRERAKELSCFYRVDEILSRPGALPDDLLSELVEALPRGWQYPEICHARVHLGGRVFEPPGFHEAPWRQAADIVVEGAKVGAVEVFYLEARPTSDEGPFLKEERRLIETIARRIGSFVLQRRLRSQYESVESAVQATAKREREWDVVLEFLRQADPDLVRRVTRKMVNHLCWAGVPEGEALLEECVTGRAAGEPDDENRPALRGRVQDVSDLADRTFQIAARHLPEEEIVTCVRAWIEEDRCTFLTETLENVRSGFAEITGAVTQYARGAVNEGRLPLALRKSLRASLLRRFFSEQLAFINVARSYVDVLDFSELAQRVIYTSGSHGKLGGKSAGLFLAAQIVRKSPEYADVLGGVRVPRTWYIASDGVLDFMHHNKLEDLYNRKYMDIDRVRLEYPHVIQVFKSSRFPPELSKGLSVALDDFEDRPLIVRSSSLLEDRAGAAFSGKYKSLFLANQGTKPQRLAALQDAVSEVYASLFGPDPIQYRSERGLLDVHEEMGIMIQEVVGRRVGRYFFPTLSGVAFSNNEFRWSPRIRREDGLARVVPGLGTRAVDRMADDYPVLLAPGQPNLRASVTADEVMRYSPRKMDVIDLERNTFATVDVRDVLRTCGDDWPQARWITSVVEEGHVRRMTALEELARDDLVVTFDGLVADTPFLRQVSSLLCLLRERMDTPVDIEFAVDGTDFYLLQCRPQSQSEDFAPAAIPRDVPAERVLFRSSRHISNGRVPPLTHVVYVDPVAYAQVADLRALKEVGRVVGKLNKLLPRRRFVLMGPGRWGSRGDIRLGVNVGYADINNTALLMEIAQPHGPYRPDLSFGTHFFQDLVEANIRYLPLYAQEPGTVLNQTFLHGAHNLLAELLPEHAHLEGTVRVLDVPRETGGRILRVLLNAERDEALGYLAAADSSADEMGAPDADAAEHASWRLRMAQRFAASMDAARFGVRAVYLVGSVQKATAGPQSDIDLLVHDGGDERQRAELRLWLDGWSHSLAEVNEMRTGHRLEGLLDVRFVDDKAIAGDPALAAKLEAVMKTARRLR